ncbi:MAG: hypothetical protein ACI4P3_02680 [Candidatus Spyradosoma sp.]
MEQNENEEYFGNAAGAEEAAPEECVPVNFDDENGEDPLKRHTKFSWKSFGGDGFIVSVIFHAVLIVFALFYVVATIEPKEPEPAEFVSGAGGGGGGENPNRQNSRMRPKSRDMKVQNKITSKSAKATLALPEMPKMNASMGSMGGMKAGGASSGLGSGTGGGIGSGNGPGIGNGRAFLSAFGSAFSKTPALTGTLYDVKRSRDGKTVYASTDGAGKNKRKEELHRALGMLVAGKFRTTELDRRYFKAGTKLRSNQIYINQRPANAATEAFANPPVSEGGKAPFDAPGWLAVYEGDVTAPETGEFRFVGMGDDVLLVGVNGEPALYAFWPGEGHGPAVPYHKGWEPEDVCGKNGKDGRNVAKVGSEHLYKGQWIRMTKGRKYHVVIAFGEGAGGSAGARLGVHQKGVFEKNEVVPVFKLGAILPELLPVLQLKGCYKAEGPSFQPPKKR